MSEPTPHIDRFLGFPRAGGRAGVRNHCLILCINGLAYQAARRAAVLVPGAAFAGHAFGRGQVGEDARLLADTAFGLAAHPNVGHSLVVGADDASVGALVDRIRDAGTSAWGLSLQSVREDARLLTETLAVRAADALQRLTEQRREPVPCSDLLIALQCGHSDFSSGLVANPVVGRVVDRLIAAGASAMFGETVEWLGAEHVLARRAATPGIAADIEARLQARVTHALQHGEDVTRHNPLPQNIAGGLTTSEEKALGAISKGGATPIVGVLAPAQRPARPGLHLMDTPFFSPESVTCLVAGGAQLVVFTTGPGNAVCSAVAPTLKVCANPDTCARLRGQIDVPLCGEIDAERSPHDPEARVLAALFATASGRLTFGEILGEGQEVFGRLARSL